MISCGSRVNNLIDTNNITCLNEKLDNSCSHVLITSSIDPNYYLESDDDDPELLLFIPFKEMVNVTGIRIYSVDSESEVRVVKVFKNASGMDFDSVEVKKATQICQGLEAIGGSVDLKLKKTSFRGVKSITLFVEENNGDDSTKIGKIDVLGIQKGGLNMKNFKPCGG